MTTSTEQFSTGHCERACCRNTGGLSLVEYPNFKADKKRGVKKGRRWYCDDCIAEMTWQMLAAPNVKLTSIEDLNTGEVTLVSDPPARLQ